MAGGGDRRQARDDCRDERVESEGEGGVGGEGGGAAEPRAAPPDRVVKGKEIAHGGGVVKARAPRHCFQHNTACIPTDPSPHG